VIDSLGYKRMGYFVLPERAWRANFYEPLGKRLKKLYGKYHENEDAIELLDLVKLEIDIYQKYHDYYGYVFFIMQNQKN
ncbi:MAG: hypothetical protein JW731_08985, partial [Bacteroidales bacterium]|nr:hypothetical protein [Bacteroidales bacterium]